MRTQTQILSLMLAILVGSATISAAGDAQWKGPARAQIKAFVKKQNGMLDLSTPIAFYGDFNGDGQEDAVVFIYTEIVGAAGNMDLKVALFKGEGDKFRFLRYAPGIYGWEPRQPKFSKGSVAITTTMLKPGEPRCCPTGSKRYTIRTR